MKIRIKKPRFRKLPYHDDEATFWEVEAWLLANVIGFLALMAWYLFAGGREWIAAHMYLILDKLN